MQILNRKLTTFQIIILGFGLTILTGSLLLTLPIATIDHQGARFSEALFTATSATCVTGLVVQDTATYWSIFGKAVILLLIQIGGMGVITMAMMFTIISGKKVTLSQRSIMQDSIAATRVGGIVRLTRFIVIWVLIIELLGALAMMPTFISDYGFLKGILFALFHSISAFCNAGFDLMGESAKFSSLTGYANNIPINLIVMILIFLGGIGFRTWDDVRNNGIHFERYNLQSKVVITTSLILIILPSIWFMFTDFINLPWQDRILKSVFQAVTTRTAGFNTVDQAALSHRSLIFTIILMMIGGSTGSTAGGMKTTTLAVILACGFSVFSKNKDVRLFKRRLADDVIRMAIAIFIIYACAVLAAGTAISSIDNQPILECLYEAASAVGTVGLTMGLTPELSALSRAILIILMFAGRVGGLTVVLATTRKSLPESGRYPLEQMTVG